MNKLQTFLKQHFLFLLILWVVPAAIYLKTLPHSLYFIDAGVTVTAAYTLGIPTPPGYPSYTMLAHLFTKLPIGDPLFRVQIFSILTSLLTLTLVYFFIQRLISVILGRSASDDSKIDSGRVYLRSLARMTSLLASLMLAFSYTFWSQTLNAQSYIFTDLLLLTVVYLLSNLEPYTLTVIASPLSGRSNDERGISIPRNDKKGLSVFKIGLISVILGAIATGGSTVMVIMVLPIVLVLFFRYWDKLGLTKTSILTIVGILLVGLIYLYLPIRARTYPFLNWGNPQTPELFLAHVQGLGLSFNDPVSGKITGLVFSPISFSKVVFRYFYLLLQQFAYIGVLFMPIGGYYLYKHNKRWFWALASIAGMNLLLGGLWLSGNQEAWFILSNIVCTIFIGLGMIYVLDVIARTQSETWRTKQSKTKSKIASLVLAMTTVVALLPLLFWFSRVNRTNEYYLKDYADNLYAPLPKNTILFGIYDTFNAATLDRHELRADRKDVFPVMTNELYVVPSYRDHLRHLRPDLVPKEIDDMTTFSSEREYNDMLNFYIVWLLKKGYPVYVSHPAYSKNVFVGAQGGVFKEDPNRLKAIPAGLSMKMELVEEPSSSVITRSPDSIGTTKQSLPAGRQGQEIATPAFDEARDDKKGPRNDIKREPAVPKEEDFNFKFKNPQEYKSPMYFLEKGYVSGYEDLVTEYGVAYIVYANWLLEQSQANPAFSNFGTPTQLSLARPRLGTQNGGGDSTFKKALEYFQKAQDIAPDSPETLTRLAIAYATQAEYKKAQLLFKKIAEGNPNNVNLQFNLAKSYADSGDTDKAKELFNNIIENSKEENQAYPASKEQLKIIDLLAKKPQNYQPFENNDMHIKFYYPEGYAITFSGNNMIKLTNNAKGKDELTMLLYSKILKDDQGLDDLGQLPFVIDGVLLQTQPGQFPGFASKMKLYSSGADTILLLELKKDRQAFAVRIFPGDSTKQQDFLDVVQSIRVLH
ncbi:MAG: hypothetical protein A3G13_01935 [Candidatus Levybacteria bacterium RIFCSPLOWO2_12_FULL_37_7]|nr:MAG: hypothetical protein A3G13_01935 [Candidatus Levybacteria bacterium RIFCSPLOWO2_12_FULL_37_7]